jgi:uncharacterized protein YjiS (DUF1127 family)
MNAYAGPDEIAIQRSDSLSHYFKDDPDDYMPQAEEERPHFFARIGAFLHWLKELPHRRTVMDELASLSDHELADIGLTRAELPRVFDEDFVAERNGLHYARHDVPVRPVPL